MNEFVGTAQFLKIALGIDLETAFSHSPNWFIFRTTCFCIKRDADEQFGTHENCPGCPR